MSALVICIRRTRLDSRHVACSLTQVDFLMTTVILFDFKRLRQKETAPELQGELHQHQGTNN